MNCKTCGGPLPPRERKAGRPPVYCSAECRQTAKRQSKNTGRNSRLAEQAAENGERVRNMRWGGG